VLRLLAARHHDLTGAENSGDLPAPRPALRLDAGRRRSPVVGPAGRADPARRPGDEAVEIERKRITLELVDIARRFDNQLIPTNQRIVEAVGASATTVTDIHGIGPLGAAIILGHTGDIARFRTSGHFARYTDSASIAAYSGPAHPAPAQPSPATGSSTGRCTSPR
jgi:transposase